MTIQHFYVFGHIPNYRPNVLVAIRASGQSEAQGAIEIRYLGGQLVGTCSEKLAYIVADHVIKDRVSKTAPLPAYRKS